MRDTVLLLDGHGDGWKVAVFDTVKENHPTACYIRSDKAAERLMCYDFAVIDCDRVDVSKIYIPSSRKIVLMSVNSDKEHDNCCTIYKFDSKSKPSFVLDVARKL